MHDIIELDVRYFNIPDNFPFYAWGALDSASPRIWILFYFEVLGKIPKLSSVSMQRASLLLSFGFVKKCFSTWLSVTISFLEPSRKRPNLLNNLTRARSSRSFTIYLRSVDKIFFDRNAITFSLLFSSNWVNNPPTASWEAPTGHRNGFC